MRDLHINLRFWCCAANEVDDLVRFAQVLRRHQVILLKHETLEPMANDEWPSIFQDARDEKWHLVEWTAHHAIAFEDWGKRNARFSFDQYKDETNKLQIGGLLDFEFQDQQPLVEPFAQRLLAIARELYPLARPTYGEVDGGMSEWDTKDVLKRRLRHIAWVNFFGPAYVEKYGKDFLLNLPGYKTEELPDGGVFHQLSPAFVAGSEKEAKALRKQVTAYCASHGQKASCRAPFYIPGLGKQTEPSESMSDDELENYLVQILATTLVLDDGTRVKPVAIPWDQLTADQGQLAIESIRRVAIAEIKRPGKQRIRFEFNEIPDDLEQVLTALAGRENPDFEWIQVDIESQSE